MCSSSYLVPVCLIIIVGMSLCVLTVVSMSLVYLNCNCIYLPSALARYMVAVVGYSHLKNLNSNGETPREREKEKQTIRARLWRTRWPQQDGSQLRTTSTATPRHL